MARILRGDIRWADLNPVRGSEQGGLRPVLILSQDIFNARSGTVIAMAITNQPKKTAFLSPWSLAPPPCRKNPGSRSARSVLLPWSASAKNSPRPAPRNWPWWWRGWGRLWGDHALAKESNPQPKALAGPMPVATKSRTAEGSLTARIPWKQTGCIFPARFSLALRKFNGSRFSAIKVSRSEQPSSFLSNQARHSSS